MYREILRLGLHARRSDPLPLWSTIGWYFFWTCQFLFYGKAVLSHFEDQRQPFMQFRLLQNALRHHTFWSFCLYCAGFVGFVLSLRQDQYHVQFSYFGRALVALLLVVVQSHFMILNVTQGLIWFILPSTLIIVNDSFAYFCGRAFGKHSLTALSPKKTWEGYLGAGVFTMISAFFLSAILSRYPSLVCPIYTFQHCTFWACPRLACDPLPYAFIPSRCLTPPFRGWIQLSRSPIALCSFTRLLSAFSRPLSLPLVVSLRLAPSVRSTLRTSRTYSQVMAVSPTVWIANCLWLCSRLCM